MDGGGALFGGKRPCFSSHVDGNCMLCNIRRVTCGRVFIFHIMQEKFAELIGNLGHFIENDTFGQIFSI